MSATYLSFLSRMIAADDDEEDEALALMMEWSSCRLGRREEKGCLSSSRAVHMHQMSMHRDVQEGRLVSRSVDCDGA
jgi:hypothetical protein